MAEIRSTCCPNQEEESSLKNRPSNLPTCGFLLLIRLVAAAVSVALVIIWVMIFPKSFDVEVEDMRASYYRTPNKYLDATFNFTLGFNNPNRMLSIYYRWLNATIERDNQTLAFKEYTNPLNEAQRPSNMTFLRLSMKSSSDGHQLNDTTGKQLWPISMGDISIVDVRIMARIQFWTTYWGLSNGHVIGILCPDVRVHPPNNDSLSASTPCRVDL